MNLLIISMQTEGSVGADGRFQTALTTFAEKVTTRVLTKVSQLSNHGMFCEGMMVRIEESEFTDGEKIAMGWSAITFIYPDVQF
jgi:hypothetical protein